jgi:hypothetical protein
LLPAFIQRSSILKVHARIIKRTEICNLPPGNKLYQRLAPCFLLSCHKVTCCANTCGQDSLAVVINRVPSVLNVIMQDCTKSQDVYRPGNKEPYLNHNSVFWIKITSYQKVPCCTYTPVRGIFGSCSHKAPCVSRQIAQVIKMHQSVVRRGGTKDNPYYNYLTNCIIQESG